MLLWLPQGLQTGLWVLGTLGTQLFTLASHQMPETASVLPVLWMRKPRLREAGHLVRLSPLQSHLLSTLRTRGLALPHAEAPSL